MDSWILPKGKYKTIDVYEVAKIDRFYLQWVLDNWDLSLEERDCIQNALNPSLESSKPAVGTKYVTEADVKKAAEFLLRKVDVISATTDPGDLASKVIREMYRMLTGKDYT